MILGYLPLGTLPLGTLDLEYEYEKRIDDNVASPRTVTVPKQNRTARPIRTED